MEKWPNASLGKCMAIDDIIAMLCGAGASIERLTLPTVDQTFDQGEAVLNDDALWAALPDRIRRIWTKDQLRNQLRTELDSSRLRAAAMATPAMAAPNASLSRSLNV